MHGWKSQKSRLKKKKKNEEEEGSGKTQNADAGKFLSKQTLRWHLDSTFMSCICVFFFFFLESLLLTFSCEQCTPVDPVYYSQDSQNSLFNNFFTINGSHDTIHIFKNYFATIFSVFSFQFSIFSCIQTDP